MTPAYRLTDPGFAYANAASHSDPAAFRERMAQRARQAEREARRQTYARECVRGLVPTETTVMSSTI